MQKVFLAVLLWLSLCLRVPGLVDGHQFLHGVALEERPGVLGAVGDDLVDGVEDGDHRVALQVPGRVLLAARQVAHQVPQRVAPWRDHKGRKRCGHV